MTEIKFCDKINKQEQTFEGGVLSMSEPIFEEMLKELREIRSTMATKSELEEIRNMMATKDEMNKGFADLKRTINEFHSENISADEKLLEAIGTTNDKLNTHDHNIDILHRNQLKLETEIEKIKTANF